MDCYSDVLSIKELFHPLFVFDHPSVSVCVWGGCVCDAAVVSNSDR